MEDSSQHYVGKVAQKAIIEKDGKILVCRGPGDSLWGFPGGRLYNGETPQEGLKREVKEELGIDVEVGGPINVCRSYHVQDERWAIFIAYRCTQIDATPMVPDPTEVEEMQWVSRSELADLPMFDGCHELADTFLER